MTPTPEEIIRIAGMPVDTLRNLQITACYHDLSTAMASRSGRSANWCTFATWASRQAGQTIRKEDLRAKMRRELHLDPGVSAIFTLLGAIAKENGGILSIEKIKETTIAHLIGEVSDRAASAVALGNKKVFEEIGLHFARFLQSCANDQVYSQHSLDVFLAQLRPGDPPGGQRYLRQAFTRYYQAIFEMNKQQSAELNFLANLEIGFHEQTRLQPEIAASLNAGMIDPQGLLAKLNSILFPPGKMMNGFHRLVSWAMGKSGLIEKHVQSLVELTSKITRKIITTHLMTLTFPPGNAVLLGRDVSGHFPAALVHLQQPDLLQLLSVIDPTRDSVVDSGAVDWSDLKERLHFIVDLFRTRHEEQLLFEPAFTEVELGDIREGKVPSYFNW